MPTESQLDIIMESQLEFKNQSKKTPEDKIRDFKKELKELLKKYNAEIYSMMDGDTHGVSVEVLIDVDKKQVIRSHDSISHYDI